MKNLTLVLSLILSAQSFAASPDSLTVLIGKTTASVTYPRGEFADNIGCGILTIVTALATLDDCLSPYDHGTTSKSITTNSRIFVKSENGKFLVTYKVDGAKKCASILKTFEASETSFQNYALYENKVLVGYLIFNGQSANLQFLREETATSLRKNADTCSWNIDPNTTLDFSLSH